MNPCETFAGQLGATFSCAPHGRYTRVRTPFIYPDGDVVDLFLHESNNSVTVSDLGESLRWLDRQSVTQKRTQRQLALLNDVLLTHGVELYKGALAVRIAAGANLADAVIRVGQAALSVAAIAL